jgi:uncharacterized membrane protein YfhO
LHCLCLRGHCLLVYNAGMSLIRRLDSFLILALLVAAFAVAPLLAGGYFWGAHDARHSVYFLVQFDRAIQDGIFYPRWAPDFNFGYGYPFFNIYSPGALFVGEALHLLGLDFVAAVKVVFALSLALSALAMYLYARCVLGSRPAALVAAAVYLYAPYHLADVFLRGALADSLCFVFFPLVLLGFHELIERPRARALVGAGAALAGLMFSHYALALLFLPFLGMYVLAVGVASGRWQSLRAAVRSLLWPVGAGLFAMALAAVLILPAALEYRYVRTDQWAGGYYSYKDHFVYFFQFFSPAWGYGPGSVAGPNDTLPFQLGVVPITLTIVSVLALVALRLRGQRETARLILFYLAATACLMLLMLNLSAPVWDALHLATFAQFPWRLLSLTTLTMAVLSGAALVVDEQQHGEVSLPLLAAVLAVVVLGSYSYLQPQLIEPPEGPVSLGGLMRFQRSSGEMTGMTAWATRPRPPDWSPLADVYVSGQMVTDKVIREQLPANVQAITTRHSTVLDEVTVSAPQPVTLAFYTAYYPGWRATIDGQAATITPAGDLGAITVAVPAGEHTVVLRFGDTAPRTVGALLSVMTAVAGLLVAVRKR